MLKRGVVRSQQAMSQEVENQKNHIMGESRGLGAGGLMHQTRFIIVKGVGKPAGVLRVGLSE